MAQANTAIVWFRRDLRLHDHPALLAACASHDALVPLFVVDPGLIAGRFASANRTWYLLESVRQLRASLRRRGSDLVITVGDPREVVPRLVGDVGATAVYVSRDHAPYGRARDGLVAAAIEARGATWHGRRGGLVHEPEEVRTSSGGSFSVYSPFRRAWEALPRRSVEGPPRAIPGLPPGHGPSGDIPSLASLGLGDGPTADQELLPEPGESAARRRLERWLTGGLERYATDRDRLDLDGATSRLSADLHIGSLSPLEVVERASGADEGRRVFVKELVWREFYGHVLFHRPAVRTAAFRSDLEHIPWSTDASSLDAWRTGQTGYPVVDAAMRQLAAMGWMSNRARLISASFLTKHLLVDWRAGEAHFMHHLVDGDVASNNGGWQWSASTGTDAQPYFRILNPILQGQRFDPDGVYVRRWVPELRAIADDRIHVPWTLTDADQAAIGCRIGVTYPAPIVDHAAARARAIAVYEATRRTS